MFLCYFCICHFISSITLICQLQPAFIYCAFIYYIHSAPTLISVLLYVNNLCSLRSPVFQFFYCLSFYIVFLCYCVTVFYFITSTIFLSLSHLSPMLLWAPLAPSNLASQTKSPQDSLPQQTKTQTLDSVLY